MQVKLFIKNTAILMITSLLLRTAGIFFRVYLAGKIGSEGIGLYQMIFSVYMFAAAFSASGICTAVTRLVSENICRGKTAVKHIMRRAVTLTLAVAVASATIIFFGAETISRFFIRDIRATLSLKILCFSLPFMGVSSCIRGYFIAVRKAGRTSASQISEQAIRIGVVIFCLYLTAGKGIEYSSAAVLSGDTVAETASCILSYLLYLADIKHIPGKGTVSGTVTKIVKIALPITGAGYLSTSLHTAESMLVPHSLSKFYGNRTRGLELFGAIRGMAIPVLFFPASFLSAVSTMLIPEISEANAQNNRDAIRRSVSSVLKLTFTLSILVSGIFMFSADDIAMLIYRNGDVGYMIKILSPIVPLMYLESVVGGMLKGLGEQNSLFRINCIDSVVRIIAVLVFLPRFGIAGYLILMTVSNSFTSLSSTHRLVKKTNISINIPGWIIKPAAAAVIGGFAARFIFSGISEVLIRTALSATVQVMLFFVLCTVFGGFYGSELKCILHKPLNNVALQRKKVYNKQ